MSDRTEGFTLIETLTVVIVLGVIAAIAIPHFLRQREEAWQGAVNSDLRNAALELAIDAANNGGQYPLALPASVVTSPNVTIAMGAGATAARICLQGDHSGLAASTYYDSTAGGLTTVAC